jgi:perosamine synthetase
MSITSDRRLSIPAREIVAVLDEFHRSTPRPVALHEPSFDGHERAYVNNCLETGWVSYLGEYVDRFEEMLSARTRIRHAVAVVNGTCGLHLSLVIAQAGMGQEVLMPAITFVAPANATALAGAIPHFVDIERTRMGIDSERLRNYLGETAEVRNGQCYNLSSGRQIKALIAVHAFGHPVDLDPLADLCEEYGIVLIEDAAEALGTLYKGRHVGNWGRLAVLSFNGNKIVSTGGGGAVLTNDENLALRARHLSTTAKMPHAWHFQHDEIGFNYRMPNTNAAIGCGQLEQLDVFLERKRALAHRYAIAFEGLDGASFIQEPAHARSNYWLNSILLSEKCAPEREKVLAEAHRRGLMLRPVWQPLHRLPMFRNCPRMDLPVSEEIASRLINLPSSATL